MAECPEELTQENVSDEDKTKSCDSCSFRGVGNPANSYCSVCDEYLCISCLEIHGSLKATRDHELVMIVKPARTVDKRKGLVTKVMICDIHRSDILTGFCVAHEEVICRLCKTTKHRKCDIQDLNEAAEERKSSVKYFIDDIQALASEFEKVKSSRQNDKSQLLDITTGIRTNVKKINEEIIVWAEKLEKNALQEIERTEKEMVSKIDHHIAETDKMIKHLEWVITEFENIGSDCTVETMVFMAKAERQIQEGKELKREIQKEIKPLTCKFKKSDKLIRFMSEVSSYGTTEIEDASSIDFKAISKIIKTADIAFNSKINGCVFMADGQLVICDSNCTVKVLTSGFNLKSEFNCESHTEDIAVLSTDEVMVTKPESKCLDVLNVRGPVGKVKSIPVGEKCWGLDIQKDNIYVSCHLQDGKGGSIKVLALDGACVNTLWINEGYPYYLSVNETEDRIIVCTANISKVLCIDMTGTTIFTYTDNQLKISLGLMFDSHDNFLACGGTSNHVHVVNKDGTKHKVLLSSADGLCEPYCLAYRSADKTLVVGQHITSSLLAFSIEI